MINNVIAVPKSYLQERKQKVMCNNSIIVISIIDTPKETNDRIFDEDTDRIITLNFSDITPGPFLHNSCDLDGIEYMNLEQANRIVEFVLRWANSDKAVNLFCNCSAGICRSGAVVSWAYKHSKMSDHDFVRLNPNIKPNEWVLWLLIYSESLKTIK
jgi:predicted protein tyrosine phosphatase